jgi:plastocyanin domain-containing protein
MANSRNQRAADNIARRKSLEERMAAQKAAALAVKRRNITIIGGAAFAVVLAIVLIAVFAAGNKKASVSGGTQTVSTTMNSGGSQDITVTAGMPVKWSITGNGNLGCMNAVACSGLFGQKAVRSGATTTVSFTPSGKGDYTVVCEHGNKVCTIHVK